jgi:UDP-N-acetylglucosamine transferase subunit ALG13
MKIFVTVGSMFPFDRLIEEMDKIAASGKHEIFAQTGESTYTPVNFSYKDFLDYSEMISRIKWADVVVSHAGVGTVIDLMSGGKPFLLVPRLSRRKEAIDDHQLELCKYLHKEFGITYLTDESRIASSLKSAKATSKRRQKSGLLPEIKKLIR